MHHFFRSIVLFVSFVAIWNCYAKIVPWLPRIDEWWLIGRPASYTREIVFDKTPIFPDWIRFQKKGSIYTIINPTDIPLYFWIEDETVPRSYQNLPDTLPENFRPGSKLVSSKTYYGLWFDSNWYKAPEWHESDTNSVIGLAPFGLLFSINEGARLSHEIPEDIYFSIPFYYNWQRWEMTWYVEYSPTLQHYYNYFEYLRSKPETGFLFLVLIGIFSIFLVIKTMRHFSRN